MAEQLPLNFQIPPESAIASYSWQELADGTGYVTLYAYATDTGSAFAYRLSKSTTYCESNKGYTTYSSNYYTRTNIASTPITFYLSAFNFPRTIQGNMIISFTWSTYTGGAGYCQYKASVLKNGVSIANQSSIQKSVPGGTYKYGGTHCLSITIPATNFSKGDILGVTIESTSTSGGSIYLHHDPMNRDWTESGGSDVGVSAATNPTIIKLELPFKVDL
jgi:hypothetical protein